MMQQAQSYILEALFPTQCIGCNKPGELWCSDCIAEIPWIMQGNACPNCGAPYGSLVCTECKERWESRVTICAASFEKSVSRALIAYKDFHERRLAVPLALGMLNALEEAAAWRCEDGKPRFCPSRIDALCFVPATHAAYARRGFDHMEDIARLLSSYSSIPLLDVLTRRSKADQRELNREERAQNLSKTVGVQHAVEGMRLLLIDDVITTGSTTREAVRTLLQAHALNVSVCAFARVW